jgi:hypothetical protein
MKATSRQKIEDKFYPIKEDELRWLKTNKVINNQAYIYFALKIENPFCDRPLKIKVKEFALRWNVPESSIYECIAKLKELESISIHTKEIVVSWKLFSQQDAPSDIPESFRDSRMDSGIPESFRDSRMDSGIPECDIYKDRVRDQTITDLDQTNSDLSCAEGEKKSESVAVPIEVMEEVRENCCLTTEIKQATLAKKTDLGEDKISAAPRKKKKFLIESATLDRLVADFESGDLPPCLPKEQLAALADAMIGEYIAAYRLSGSIKSNSLNDYDEAFLAYCANHHLTGELKGKLDKARSMIRNKEQDYAKWGGLVDLVKGWQETLAKPKLMDENGQEATGVFAESAAAVVNNPLLQKMLGIKINE